MIFSSCKNKQIACLAVVLFRLLFVTAFSIIRLSTIAQVGSVNLTATPVTPNAASLGKFVEVPVGYYSGIPAINIPLYTFSAGMIEIPLSLGYHASGIKVKDIPGWVGTGWTLNAGGMITRIVRGTPDQHYQSANVDADVAYLRNKLTKLPYSGFETRLSAAEQMNILTTLPGISSEFAQENHLPRMDTEFDLFSFNFLGYSGRFTFNDKGEVISLPLSDLKIEFADQKFKITDGKGFEYFFEEIELSGPLEMYQEPSYITSWCLSRIVVPHTKDEVKFRYKNYQNSQLYDYMPASRPGISRILLTDYSLNTRVSGPELWQETCTPQQRSVASEMYPAAQGTAKFLDSIIYKTDTIRLYSVNAAGDMYKCTLDSIVVKSGLDIITNIRLGYGYFNNSQPYSPYKKKYLDYVTINDQRYKFNYYDKLHGLGVPHFDKTGEDLWGYYNGEDNSDGFLVYKGYFDIPGYDQYRPFGTGAISNNTRVNSDYKYAQLGSLQSIEYPTGGKIEYEYEGNDYSRISFVDTTSKIENDPGMQLILDSSHFANAETGVWEVDQGGYSPLEPASATETTEFLVHYSQPVSLHLKMGVNFSLEWSGYQDSLYTSYYNRVYSQVVLLKFNDETAQFELMLERSHYPLYKIGFTEHDLEFAALRDASRLDTTYTLSLPEGRYRLISKAVGYKMDASAQAAIKFTYMKAPNIYNAGGLRIKKIRLYDLSTDGYIEKHYSYNNNDLSSGVLESPFANVRASQHWGKKVEWGEQVGQTTVYFEKKENCIFLDFYDTPLLPLGNSQGGIIGYSKVTETNSDGGKTVYHFTNGYDNGHEYADIFSEQRLLDNLVTRGNLLKDNSWKRGLLTQTDIYNSTDQLLRQHFSQYKFLENAGLSSASAIFETSFVSDLPNNNPSVISIGSYIPLSLTYKVVNAFQAIKTKDSTVNYLSPGTLSETKSYEYLRYTVNPVKITQINSTGDTIETLMKYPTEFAVGANPSSGIARALKNMSDKNIISTPVETYVRRRTPGQPDWLTTSGQLIRFREDLPFPDTVFSLRSYGITGYQGIKIDSVNFNRHTAYQPELIFARYSTYGNVLEQSRYNDINEVLLWGYQHRYLVCRVIGSDYNTVISLVDTNIINNPVNDAQLLYELNKIRTHFQHSAGVLVSTYAYANLKGMTAEVNPAGQKTSFIYDRQGRLALVSDNNGKILRKICYNYYGQPENCHVELFGNAQMQQIFTKNNCTQDSTGADISYVVPANRYYAATQSMADSLASQDIQQNGQAFANQHGRCVMMNEAILVEFESGAGFGEYYTTLEDSPLPGQALILYEEPSALFVAPALSLNPTKSYVVTYWTDGDAFILQDNTSQLSITTSTIGTHGSWRKYESTFTGASGNLWFLVINSGYLMDFRIREQ